MNYWLRLIVTYCNNERYLQAFYISERNYQDKLADAELIKLFEILVPKKISLIWSYNEISKRKNKKW